MANKPISTPNVTMGRHGRIHEQEAEREKGVTFGEPHPPTAPKTDLPAETLDPKPVPAADPQRAEEARKAAQKPVEEVAVALVGPMLLADVEAALSDRYPHNDIHTMEGATIEVKVPTGVILVDFKAVNKCKNTADLRAYIDSLPVL